MNLKEINNKYGKYIWGVANRYHTGIWNPEDVYNEILILLNTAINDGKIDSAESENTVKRIKSFIITRAINIVNHEKVRRFISIEKLQFDDEIEIDAVAPPTPEALNFEIELVRELLFTRLDEPTAKFIFELAFPSDDTIQIAMDEQQEAREDTNLRMNINKLKVLPKHVSAHFKSMGMFSPSPATISRLRKKAAEIYNEND
jgi:hypothetical protein